MLWNPSPRNRLPTWSTESTKNWINQTTKLMRNGSISKLAIQWHPVRKDAMKKLSVGNETSNVCIRGPKWMSCRTEHSNSVITGAQLDNIDWLTMNLKNGYMFSSFSLHNMRISVSFWGGSVVLSCNSVHFKGTLELCGGRLEATQHIKSYYIIVEFADDTTTGSGRSHSVLGYW